MSTRAGLPRAWVVACQLAALCAFALAQPVFDLLGRNPTFFVAHHAGPADIVLFALAVALAPVMLMLVLVGAFGLLGRPRWGLFAAVAVLVALVALPPLHRAGTAPGWAFVLGALVLGGLAAIAYARVGAVRTFFTLLGVAALAFPLLFLLHSPVARLVRPEHTPKLRAAGVRSTPPIVFVIFDALSLASLLDESGGIDAVRYPAFARLAASATWYRDTTTVADVTPLAVPAVLTGQYPNPHRIPAAVDYPRNLFTLLAGAYDMSVHETITEMCPDWLCGAVVREPWPARLGLMLADAAIVYAHLLLPADLAEGLPSIEEKWRDFWVPVVRPVEGDFLPKAMAEAAADRAAQFARFLADLVPRPRPTLYFHHSLLPHSPFVYFPTGRRYAAPGGLWGTIFGRFTRDGVAAEVAEQRYLLQVGFADRLLGRLLERLDATGMLDSALLVMTADHGSAFVPGEPHRALTDGNLEDIVAVPLFIKEPGQRRAIVRDQRLETADVLPTLAELLGIDIPWHVDGRSALAEPRPDHRVFVHQSGEAVRVRRRPGGLQQTVSRRIARLGARSAWSTTFEGGPYGGLVGQPADPLATAPAAPYRVELAGGAVRDVDEQKPLPAYLEGRLVLTGAAAPGAPSVAVAVNGTIADIARTRRLRGALEFSALVSEASLRPGTNRYDLFVIDDREPGRVRLARVPAPGTASAASPR